MSKVPFLGGIEGNLHLIYKQILKGKYWEPFKGIKQLNALPTESEPWGDAPQTPRTQGTAASPEPPPDDYLREVKTRFALLEWQWSP
jgi:hypothetical protein